MITGTAVRLEVFRNLAAKYKTVEEAEDDLGLGVGEYLGDDCDNHPILESESPNPTNVDLSDMLIEKIKLLPQDQMKKLVFVSITLLKEKALQDLVNTITSKLDDSSIKQKLYVVFLGSWTKIHRKHYWMSCSWL